MDHLVPDIAAYAAYCILLLPVSFEHTVGRIKEVFFFAYSKTFSGQSKW
jgi:hypothetical protein